MIQILTFLRTDVPHNKLKVMAIRPETVPGLKPSTLGYMSKILSESNVGVKSARKDFLDNTINFSNQTPKVL